MNGSCEYGNGAKQMGKCIIIGGMYRGEEPDFLKKEKGDLLLCADSGYLKAVQYGMEPDLVIGDFDSMDLSELGDVARLVLPVKKDDTDMHICIKKGREAGYSEFRIGGGLNGRLDHTVANIQCLAELAESGGQGWLVDSCNRVSVLASGAYSFSAVPGRYLSLFAFTETVQGLSLRGTEWELENAELRQTYPVGCSNWFREDRFTLSFSGGLLLIGFCGDRPCAKMPSTDRI